MRRNRVILSDMTDQAPRIDGKFLRVAGQRFLVKGVTYGTFAPDETGHQFPPIDRVRASGPGKGP